MEANNIDEINLNYFKLDYSDQNYKTSHLYRKWVEINRPNDNNRVEIKCEKDNIIFFKSKNKSSARCPICHSEYFKCSSCGRVSNEYLKERCCIRSYFKKLIKDGDIYQFTGEDLGEVGKKSLICYFLVCLIPGIIGLGFHIISLSLFLLQLKDKKNIEYPDRVKNMSIFFSYLSFITFSLFVFLICEVYAIFFYSVFLLALLISLPFKFYPLKLIFGLIRKMIG